VDELTHLLLGAADGDRDALAAFVAETQADVWRFCASMVGSDAADDAVQETFVRAWRSVRTFRGDASAKTWLLAIAKRVSFGMLKRRGRDAGAGFQLGQSGQAGSTERAADAGELVALTDLVARLEPDRRSAFVLTQLLGLGYLEAAEVCGCPVGTIRSRVARARADLFAAASSGEADRSHSADGA
jgi:RNA polymerase sigma-70 factor, ECF subfamily